LCFGCGSRKVVLNKSDTEKKTQQSETVKNDIVIDSNLKIETITKVNDSTKEVIEETIIEADDKSKPAINDGKELGNTKITKRKTTRNKALKTDNNTNTLINEKTTDKTNTNTKKQEQTKKIVQAKQSQREGLIKWWWFPLILVILFVCWKIYRKISSKIP
jgi:hypothetical protein